MTPVTPDPIAEMDKAVRCLALELPEAVHADVRAKWEAARPLLRPPAAPLDAPAVAWMGEALDALQRHVFGDRCTKVSIGERIKAIQDTLASLPGTAAGVDLEALRSAQSTLCQYLCGKAANRGIHAPSCHTATRYLNDLECGIPSGREGSGGAARRRLAVHFENGAIVEFNPKSFDSGKEYESVVFVEEGRKDLEPSARSGLREPSARAWSQESPTEQGWYFLCTREAPDNEAMEPVMVHDSGRGPQWWHVVNECWCDLPPGAWWAGPIPEPEARSAPEPKAKGPSLSSLPSREKDNT